MNNEKFSNIIKFCYLLVILIIPMIYCIYMVKTSLSGIGVYYTTANLNVEKFKVVFDYCFKNITIYYGLYIIMILFNYSISTSKSNKILIIFGICEILGILLGTYPYHNWEETFFLLTAPFASIFLFIINKLKKY